MVTSKDQGGLFCDLAFHYFGTCTILEENEKKQGKSPPNKKKVTNSLVRCGFRIRLKLIESK